MKILPWHDWLDQHIPYYEAYRFRGQYAMDPPCEVLCMGVRDRQAVPRGKISPDPWSEMDQIVAGSPGRVESLFLERDTRGEWYWAFWNPGSALLVVLKLQ